MYLTIKQNLKHLSKNEYMILRKLCRVSKNLRNQAMYEIRQEYFRSKKYLNYYDVYRLIRGSENYKILNANMAQQIIKKVNIDFESFFASLRAKQATLSEYKVSIPKYLPKDGYADLVVQAIYLNKGVFQIPYSLEFAKTHKKIYIKIPPCLEGKKIREIKIIPKYKARYFEITYTYKVEDIEKVKLDNNKALAIDLGVNNLCTCVTSEGNSFIIDGKRIKSINQWCDKEIARLDLVKDKQGYGKEPTKRQICVFVRRNNRIRDYFGKVAKQIVTYCVTNDIGNLVFGLSKGMQQRAKLGKKNNQIFIQIPYYRLKCKLEYLCKLNGITFITQEEAYTSKASFLDKDPIPVLGDENIPKFSGKRIKRGLYKTANGTLINADVNGALNILRKSNVVSLEALYSRGNLGTPIRIRVA